MTPKANPNVNYGLYLKYQYWFINCNRYTTLMQDVSNRGNCAEGEKEYMGTLYFSLKFSVSPKLL